MNFEEMIRRGHEAGASDLHLVAGGRAMLRRHGALEVLPDVLASEAIREIFAGLLDETQVQELHARRSVDLALTVAGVVVSVAVGGRPKDGP